MSIRFAFRKPDVSKSNMFGWLVAHPTNGAILAYCDSEEEANGVADAWERLVHAELDE